MKKTQWTCLVVAIILTAFGLFDSPSRVTAQCPCPCPCPCKQLNVVNIKGAQQVPCKLQIEGSGTYAVATGYTLVKVNLVALNVNTLTTTRIQATVNNGEWSVPNGAVAAGTYDVSAEIVTKDPCGKEVTTKSAAGQTVSGLVVK